MWTHETRETWEAPWGPVDDPVSKTDHPASWQVLEDELPGAVLVGYPDEIEYPSYETVEAFVVTCGLQN